MKKLLFFVLAVSCFAISTANAQSVDVFFSTSNSDPNAGSVLELVDGQGPGSLFVWVENTDVAAIIGLPLDVDGAGSSALNADSFIIDNPVIFPGFTRWTPPVGTGVLGTSPGKLVDDANAAAVTFATGIANAGGPVLHAELILSGTGIFNDNVLTLSAGAQQIVLQGSISPTATNFGTARVNVVPVPEPSTLGLVGSLVGCALLRRRRRA